MPNSDLSNNGGCPLSKTWCCKPSGMLCHTDGRVGSDISKDRSVFILRVISPRCLYPWTPVPSGQNVRKYLPNSTMARHARRLALSLTQLRGRCHGRCYREVRSIVIRWRVSHEMLVKTMEPASLCHGQKFLNYRHSNAICRFVCYIRIFYVIWNDWLNL